MNWTNDFKNRIQDFEGQFNEKNSFALSIKIRVSSGCFHREHSPEAYRFIDNEIEQFDFKKEKIALVEHESGPEILVYVAFTTVAIQLSSAVLDLIRVIIEGRKKGIEKGDHPRDDLHLIVRGFNKKGDLKDEKILTINRLDKIDKKTLKSLIEKSINETLKDKNK